MADLPQVHGGQRITVARWLGIAATLVLGVAAIWLFARILGLRSPLFAFELHFVLMAVAASIDRLAAPELRSRWFDVGAGEVRIFERLGVHAFRRFLGAIGWNALIRDKRMFDGTRATLASYERATRHGENAHIWLFVVVLAPIAWALWKGWWDAAFWLGSMSVLFHVYPVMLQRTMRARLTALLRRVRGE
ncbi:MAG: hypothetical protein JNL28_01265 [Planctomycetes bacterium]|nr:hypothetical protein [Planctomycetota bacterium]